VTAALVAVAAVLAGAAVPRVATSSPKVDAAIEALREAAPRTAVATVRAATLPLLPLLPPPLPLLPPPPLLLLPPPPPPLLLLLLLLLLQKASPRDSLVSAPLAAAALARSTASAPTFCRWRAPEAPPARVASLANGCSRLGRSAPSRLRAHCERLLLAAAAAATPSSGGAFRAPARAAAARAAAAADAPRPSLHAEGSAAARGRSPSWLTAATASGTRRGRASRLAVSAAWTRIRTHAREGHTPKVSTQN
jgi:hypothetical protein